MEPAFAFASSISLAALLQHSHHPGLRRTAHLGNHRADSAGQQILDLHLFVAMRLFYVSVVSLGRLV